MATIKKVLKKDVGKFASIGADAFPGMGIHTVDEKNKLKQRLLERLEKPGRVLWGYYDKKELYGGLFLYDFTMNLFGNKILCGGGGFLAVDLLHKKEHVARELCLFFLRHYRKRRSSMTSLYPFRPDFYRKMGVGYGMKTSIYRFSPSNLPAHGDKSKVRELSIDTPG